MFARVYLCLPLFTCVHLLPLFTRSLYLCLPIFTRFYLRFANVYSYILMFTGAMFTSLLVFTCLLGIVYLYLPLFTYVYTYLPMFTLVQVLY